MPHYKLKAYELYFVLNGLWQGEEGYEARTVGGPGKLQRDGWYWITDGMDDGVGPFLSEAAANRSARGAIDEAIASGRYWRIFSKGHHVVDIPVNENDPRGNGGLPCWYFEGEFVSLEINFRDDTVEWVPAVGPAPTWEVKLSEFKDNTELYRAFNQWAIQTHGMSAHAVVVNNE